MAEFKNETESMSYALGLHFGQYLMSQPVPMDPEQVLRGIADMLNRKPAMSQEEFGTNMQQLQQKQQDAGRQEAERLGRENAEAEEIFLADNAKADGVVTLPSGLQYQVLEEGKGAKPSALDKVRVHYTGSLLSGQVFDSSVQRGQPAEFGVNQVIPGWVEGLQLMPAGSKYKFFIPAQLAYGERGNQVIPPNATLVFEVELLDIL